MGREQYREHFEALELPFGANLADVNKAYRLLRDIYAKDSSVLTAMPEEISAEQTESILESIENSYRVLIGMFVEESHRVTEFVDRLVDDIDDFDGAVLRNIRLSLNVSLDDVAMDTRIGRKHLENIEADNFKELPVAVYARGFVLNYAKFLSLDPEVVAESYMEKFHKFRKANS